MTRAQDEYQRKLMDAVRSNLEMVDHWLTANQSGLALKQARFALGRCQSLVECIERAIRKEITADV